jgi:P27 family predicted phage terminase small subunit
MPRVDTSPPAHLTEAARVVWQATIEAMAAVRTLDVAALPLIERYCVWVTRWRHAEAQLADEGIILTAPRSGVPMISAWHSIARAAAAQCTRLETELALAPARRTRAAPAGRPIQANGEPAPLSQMERMFLAE